MGPLRCSRQPSSARSCRVEGYARPSSRCPDGMSSTHATLRVTQRVLWQKHPSVANDARVLRYTRPLKGALLSTVHRGVRKPRPPPDAGRLQPAAGPHQLATSARAAIRSHMPQGRPAAHADGRTWARALSVWTELLPTDEPESQSSELRRGTFGSVADLKAAIATFIDGWNDRCQPFVWTKTADQLLEHCRPSKKTSFTRH
jgi:hypothetical protein